MPRLPTSRIKLKMKESTSFRLKWIWIPGTSTDQVFPGHFLDVESLCELLKNETFTVSTIPEGLKENTYFVLNNNKNVAKRNREKKTNFEDDCWVSLSKPSLTKKKTFHCLSGNFKIIKKEGQYSTKRKNEWVQLKHQPFDDDNMIIRRF